MYDPVGDFCECLSNLSPEDRCEWIWVCCWGTGHYPSLKADTKFDPDVPIDQQADPITLADLAGHLQQLIDDTNLEAAFLIGGLLRIPASMVQSPF